MSICAVILAGGNGSRLWPMSRQSLPKQFLPICEENTMLQSTFLRLSGCEVDTSIVICNEEHRFFVAEQFRDIGAAGSFILEPVGRNTAPAIALAAHLVEGDSLMLVVPSDHVINNQEAFSEAIASAVPLANSGKLVTFGIVPREPNTGYGYIKKGDIIGPGYEVDSFVEKPNLRAATEYLASGEYFWNSGIFLFKASDFLTELKKFRPNIYYNCKEAVELRVEDMDFTRINKDVFEKCDSESIDFAVMENTDQSVVVPMDAGWSDLGSWASVWKNAKKDGNGNVIQDDGIFVDSRNCYVKSDKALVAAVGLDGIAIVATRDAVLVSSMSSVQDVKLVVEQLKSDSRKEYQHHHKEYRPWGNYEVICEGVGYKTKRITVNPGAKLSVQMHYHRAEHWVVVSGEAQVTNGERQFTLLENESSYIPIGVIHSLANFSDVALEIIEVQTGSYLGEDDIVRFEDIYGRR